ncbi:MAG: DUF2911 domain-containing protein [Cyclobacteriaceae bacterium]|nr:DUF2911 domain-containing protein [Cyclobacteriaceae bacterium SS2]
MKSKLILGLGLLLLAFVSTAQIVFPVLSPRGSITQWVGNTYVTIGYERPAARGREIFGNLVPYGELWRTGAGYCTQISVDQPVKIGNERVAAGRYSLFTIPGKEEWVVILNADTTLYGTYGYNPARDVIRFIAKPRPSSRFYESLTFDIDVVPNDAVVYLSWANTQISFTINTTIDEEILDGVRVELLEGESDDPNQYALAAEYMIMQNTNLYDALVLAQKAVALDPNSWARMLKIQVLERLHRYEEALTEIQAGKENVKTRKYSKKEYMENDLQYWDKHATRIKNKIAEESNE